MALTKVSRGLLSTGIVDNSNATAITIDSSENVGIGTSSPAGKLDVSVASNQRVRFDNFGGTSRISSRNDAAAILPLFIDASDLILNSGSGGSVGIGTTDADSKLKVELKPSGTVLASLRVGYNGTSVNYLDGDTNIFRNGAGSAERMRILSSGDVLFGKTNPAVAAAGGSIVGSSISMTQNSGNSYHFHDGTNYKFYVNANGGIYNFQANNVNLSDEREKKNIETLESQWDSLKQWSLKKFHYNADDDSESKKYGVIAQEVETHNPEVVADFMSTETETRLAVKEQQMMWLAIKALQEAQTRIETLEAKVQTLENN